MLQGNPSKPARVWGSHMQRVHRRVRNLVTLIRERHGLVRMETCVALLSGVWSGPTSPAVKAQRKGIENSFVRQVQALSQANQRLSTTKKLQIALNGCPGPPKTQFPPIEHRGIRGLSGLTENQLSKPRCCRFRKVFGNQSIFGRTKCSDGMPLRPIPGHPGQLQEGFVLEEVAVAHLPCRCCYRVDLNSRASWLVSSANPPQL